MKQKLIEFMRGRYGIDQLNNFLSWLFLFLALIGVFSRQWIFTLLAFVVIGITYFRMFSRNFQKRYNENRIFTNFMGPYYDFEEKVKNFFAKKKRRHQDKKTHRYFKCPNCKQELRVPKGKGKITITCPKCHHQFDRKS